MSSGFFTMFACPAIAAFLGESASRRPERVTDRVQSICFVLYMYYIMLFTIDLICLVVSTPLKNISQLGWLSHLFTMDVSIFFRHRDIWSQALHFLRGISLPRQGPNLQRGQGIGVLTGDPVIQRGERIPCKNGEIHRKIMGKWRNSWENHRKIMGKWRNL